MFLGAVQILRNHFRGGGSSQSITTDYNFHRGLGVKPKYYSITICEEGDGVDIVSFSCTKSTFKCSFWSN